MPFMRSIRNDAWSVLAIAIVAGVCCTVGPTASTNGLEMARGFIKYRGESIRLSRAYYDYDDYKNDPNNIHPDETATPRITLR